MTLPISVFTVGDVQLQLVAESSGPLLQPSELYPQYCPSVHGLAQKWLEPPYYDASSDRLVLAMQSFVLRSNNKIVLVDTCVGDCKKRVRPEFDGARWNWLDRLAAAGIAPHQVDIVLSTHLHVDHVGWHTQWLDGRWQPTFPNARYLFVDTEYDYWCSTEGRQALQRTGDYVEDSVKPVFDAGLADIVDAHHVIDQHLRLVPSHGHTPGHVCVEIASQGQSAVIIGDLLHHPLQCRFPNWSTRFCFDADQSRQTRLRLMRQYAHDQTLVFPAHFPAPTAGRLQSVNAQDAYFDYLFVSPDHVITDA